MSEAHLVAVLAWPVVAAFAICGAIGVALVILVPFGARERLASLARSQDAHAQLAAELRERVAMLESQSSPAYASVLERLRGGGR